MREEPGLKDERVVLNRAAALYFTMSQCITGGKALHVPSKSALTRCSKWTINVMIYNKHVIYSTCHIMVDTTV